MKETHGWFWPDHEQHMPAWMASPKNRIKLNGRWAYQGRKQEAFIRHCRTFDTVLDVGSHVGLWSFNFAHAFKKVEAFEPVAEHRECFVKNTDGLSNITLHACALGKEENMVSMWTENGSSGNTQVRGAGEIPMKTIDSFGFADVSAMKLDTEGFEENILRGSVETIRRWKPTVIVEQKTNMAARFDLPILGAVDFLKSLGYKVVAEISGDFVCIPA